MIWNIWYLYGLTGGWWVDKTATVFDYEDQQGIINTYISVAKLSANAAKIRRF